MNEFIPDDSQVGGGEEAAEDIDYGVLVNDVGFNCRLAQLVLFSKFYEAFSDINLSPAEFSTLLIINQNPGIRQGNLGSALYIKRSALTKMMKGLEARGLVTRKSPNHDLRSLELRLSPTGMALVESKLPHMEAHISDAVTNLSVAERGILLELLRKVVGGSSGRSSKNLGSNS